MTFRTTFRDKHNNYLVYILVFAIIKSSSSNLSESESLENLDNDIQESKASASPQRPQRQPQTQPQTHILINANHIVEFIQSMKRSQDDMFRKIETLAKSVEFTDNNVHSKSSWDSKFAALENRILEIERSLPRRLDALIQQNIDPTQNIVTKLHEPSHYNSSTGFERPYSPPPPLPPPWSTLSTINQLRSDFKIERPFTPPPLFPVRNSRDTMPAFFTVGSSNRAPYSSPGLQVRSGSRGQQLHHQGVGHHGVGHHQDRLNVLGQTSSSREQPLSGVSVTEHLDMNTVMRRIADLESSVEELQLNASSSSKHTTSSPFHSQSSDEVLELKEKHAQLQRAVDTVLIHFSGIFRTLEKVEGRIEGCCGNNVSASTTNQTPTLEFESNFPATYSTMSAKKTTPKPYPSNSGNTGGGITYHNGVGDIISEIHYPPTDSYDKYTTTPESNNFGDYGRATDNDNDNDNNEGIHNWVIDPNPRQTNNNDNWLDNLSVERNEPDPEPVDFSTYAFLRGPAQSSKMSTKSLRRMSNNEGETPRGRAARDLSFIARTMRNLTKQVGKQKKQIDSLSHELARVNVSHALLLKSVNDDTLKRTIRPRDCSEIQLLLQIANSKNETLQSKSENAVESSAAKFTIFPKQNDEPVQVICDLDASSDGGGWTIIQRRGVPLPKGRLRTDFYRNWTDYEQGFGPVDGDYWLGLSNIAALSKLGDQELGIELTKWDGTKGKAFYKHFSVDDATAFYRLHVSQYSGNIGDSLTRHNEMPFSTYDQDHDTDPQRNCAQVWKGAWWYYGCLNSNLNGLYALNDNGTHEFGTGIVWQHWTGNYYSIKQVDMKIRNRLISPWRTSRIQ